jgi:hypothetical protein
MYYVTLVVVVAAGGRADGGRDEKMFDNSVFNNRYCNRTKEYSKVLSPPSIALGLNSSSLASLHLLSLGPRALCYGSLTVASRLATRLVCIGNIVQRVVQLVRLTVRTCTHREVLVLQYTSSPSLNCTSDVPTLYVLPKEKYGPNE